MLRGMVFFMAIIVALFCLQLAITGGVVQSHGDVSSCESVMQQKTCLSLIAVVDMNVHGPPNISAGSAKESSTRSESLKNTMPGWAKYDVEDLPQIKYAFLKIFHHDPTENFGLSPLSEAPTWSDKSKLRTLRPPVRAAPHA